MKFPITLTASFDIVEYCNKYIVCEGHEILYSLWKGDT